MFFSNGSYPKILSNQKLFCYSPELRQKYALIQNLIIIGQHTCAVATIIPKTIFFDSKYWKININYRISIIYRLSQLFRYFITSHEQIKLINWCLSCLGLRQKCINYFLWLWNVKISQKMEIEILVIKQLTLYLTLYTA